LRRNIGTILSFIKIGFYFKQPTFLKRYYYLQYFEQRDPLSVLPLLITRI
jgi:hypothetical protein